MISLNLTPQPELKLPGFLANQPRVMLANLPTPVESLARFSAALGGPSVFIKRDDLTGLATGGNKVRKLEFLLGAALKEGADVVITAGGPQSNHCRQTAAAAARLGLPCHLVFGGSSDSPLVGNRYLDYLFGVHEHWTPKGTREAKMEELRQLLIQQGQKPFVIPVGGSNSIGALGFAVAMFELAEQMAQHSLEFDHIVFATSSGGTQSGIVIGSKLTKCPAELIAISIDQVPDGTSDFDYKAFVCSIASEMTQKLALPVNISLDDFPINYDHLGEGYGVVGDPEREAIMLLAQTEGILIDPVYAGRALAGLMALIRAGRFADSDRVLFWHTGGDAALHAYVRDLAH